MKNMKKIICDRTAPVALFALLYVKNNQEFHNINLFSVSLDDNLYETLKKINIKNIHRLLVEDDIKKE